MKRVLQGLIAPNLWVTVFALLAVIGLSCVVLGGLIQSSPVKQIGFWLLVPFLFTGLTVATVIIPLLVAKRAVMRRREAYSEQPIVRELAYPGSLGHLMAFEDRPAGTSTAGPSTPDRVIPVPPNQAVWLSGTPATLTVIVAAPTDAPTGGLAVKTSPLTLVGEVRCTGWLADSGPTVLARGTRGTVTLDFVLQVGDKPAFFVEEYRSAKADVLFAVALDGAAIPSAVLSRLFKVAIEDVATTDPTRAATLTANVPRY